MDISLAELARHLGARLVGDSGRSICGVAALDSASPDQITFVADAKYVSRLRSSRAGAAIVGKRVERLDMAQLIVDDVDAALLKVLSLFAEKDDLCPGVHPTARIGKDVTLGKGIGIGPHVVIADGVTIGDDTFIAAGCTIGRNARIGAGCRLYAGVVVYERCEIGNNVVIQANSVIGSVGFGYAYIDGQHRLVPHIGNVVIEDRVEIGANTCIDRAKFGSTRIGAGTKIDNLVQIAHNVTIGRLAGIAGSCRLGDGVVLGGQVGVRDHVTIGDGAMVGGKSFVMQDIPAGEKVFGLPAMEKNKALRVLYATRRLPDLIARVGKLEDDSGFEQELKAAVAEECRGLRFSRLAAAVFVFAALGLLAGVILSGGVRRWLDPDEVRVEKMVASYQDGDDWFFEDLRTNDRLMLIEDLEELIERKLEEHAAIGDCYFLVPLSSIEKLRRGRLREQLFLVTTVPIRDHIYALVTNESDHSFMEL
jgi:UDP-3-O-[3-hydroxymyristoyl] glucosamine N-acyltransferase